MKSSDFMKRVPLAFITGHEKEESPSIYGDQDSTESDDEPELDYMLPPLQQKIEILKKNAGLANVFDQQGKQDKETQQLNINIRNINNEPFN